MGPAVTGPGRQHPGASDATRHALIPGAGAIRQADIIELILADHRRIRRLCDALYDPARYDGGPRPDWMLGPMWQRLADLLVAHTQAEEETLLSAPVRHWGAGHRTDAGLDRRPRRNPRDHR